MVPNQVAKDKMCTVPAVAEDIVFNGEPDTYPASPRAAKIEADRKMLLFHSLFGVQFVESHPGRPGAVLSSPPDSEVAASLAVKRGDAGFDPVWRAAAGGRKQETEAPLFTAFGWKPRAWTRKVAKRKERQRILFGGTERKR